MRASVSTTQDLGMPAIYLHLLAELLSTIGVDEKALLKRYHRDFSNNNQLQRRKK